MAGPKLLAICLIRPKFRASLNTGVFDMSQHPSLKKSGSVGAKRSVMKRFERIKALKERGEWKDGQSAIGLPKTKPDA